MPILDNMKMLIAVSLGIAILIIMTIYIVYKKHRDDEDPFESMEGEEFERYCVMLLSRQGYEEVCQTQSSHDYGVDIFADKDGISYAIQCKCYSSPIGIKAIQEVYAGRDYYDCMVGVVMTNQYFTKPAIEYAKKLNILLWGADDLSEMIRRYGGAGMEGGNIRSLPDKNQNELKVKQNSFVRARKNLARAIARQTVKKQRRREESIQKNELNGVENKQNGE